MTQAHHSIRFAQNKEKLSVKALHIWSDGRARLQRLSTSGWIGLDSESGACQDWIALKFKDNIIPLHLPQEISDGELEIEALTVNNLLIRLNGKPWVGLISNLNDPLPLEAKQWVCTLLPTIVPDQIDSLNLVEINTADLGNVSNSAHLKRLRCFNCKELENIDAVGTLPKIERIRFHRCNMIRHLRIADPIKSLTALSFERCDALKRLPDFSLFPNLTHLNIHWCGNVDRLDGLETNESIESVDLRACNALRTIPLGSENSRLSKLTVAWFKLSTTLPHLPDMKGLRHVQLFANAELTKTPDFSGLEQLQTINLSGCTQLETFELETNLPELAELNLSGCSGLKSLNLNGMPKLKELHLGRCSNLCELSELNKTQELQAVHISGASQLKAMDGLNELQSLHSLYVGDCNQIEVLSLGNNNFNVNELHIYGCNALREINGRLVGLKRLQVGGCRSLSSLPDFGENVEELTLSWLDQLELPDFQMLKNLKRLKLSGRANLKDILHLDMLPSLEKLELSRCAGLEKIGDISHLNRLTTLDLRGCESIRRIDGLGGLIELNTLLLGGCHALMEIDDVLFLSELKHLDLAHCRNLTHLPDLSELKKLQILDLSHRIAPINLKPLSRLTQLHELNLDESDNVTQLDSLSKAEKLKDLIWVDHAQSQSVLAATALARGDLPEISKRIGDWLQALRHTKDADKFAKRLAGCLQLSQDLSWSQSKWAEFIRTCKSRAIEGKKPLAAETWEAVFHSSAVAGQLPATLEQIVKDIDPRTEGDTILKPALQMTHCLKGAEKDVFAACLELTAAELSPSLKRRFGQDLALAFAALEDGDAIKELLAEQDHHPQSELRRKRLIVALKKWAIKAKKEAWIDAICA